MAKISNKILRTLEGKKDGVTVAELSKAVYGRNGVHNRNKLYRMISFIRRTGVKVGFEEGKYNLLDAD